MIAALLLNLIFVSSILGCHFSGNDKAPFLVLGTSAVSFVVAIGFLVGRQWAVAIACAAPVIYLATVIALARMELVNSQFFLGFR